MNHDTLTLDVRSRTAWWVRPALALAATLAHLVAQHGSQYRVEGDRWRPMRFTSELRFDVDETPEADGD